MNEDQIPPKKRRLLILGFLSAEGARTPKTAVPFVKLVKGVNSARAPSRKDYPYMPVVFDKELREMRELQQVRVQGLLIPDNHGRKREVHMISLTPAGQHEFALHQARIAEILSKQAI